MRPRYGPAGTRGHRITGRRSRCRSRQETKTRRRRAARIDARAHPVIAGGGPQIFGDPDARFTDLVSLIIATAASLRV
jgi:hypothetical protein